MRRGRTFILLGLVLLLGAGAVILWSSQQPPPAPEGGGEPTLTPTPVIEMQQIIVAAQNIPRGSIITSDAVYPVDWPKDSVPPGSFTDVEEVQNRIARTDILYNQPIMDVMLTNDRSQLTSRGSDASLLIPNDKRAIALPIDQLASVGYALRPGDHVDVLVSMWLIDVDRDGQFPAVPFNRGLVDELIAAGMSPEQATNLVAQQATSVNPIPRLASQIMLQDLEVLSVGVWQEPTPLPRFTPNPPPEAATATPLPPQPGPGATPTATAIPPNVVILIVSPQQTLILQWLRESDAIIDLALRGATDRAPVDTSAITLQYLFENFNVTLPPKLDFAINYIPPANAASCPERWTKESCR